MAEDSADKKNQVCERRYSINNSMRSKCWETG